jgi:hypothetical protein
MFWASQDCITAGPTRITIDDDGSTKAMAEDNAAEIKRRQQLLFDAFRHEGVLGGRYLAPTIDIERAIGEKLSDTYYGHRVLTDSFLDFFGGTLLQQIEINNKIGWLQQDQYYATCLMMFLAMFRSIRASDIASVHAYPLQGYIIQRSIKDQAFVLCAAANGAASFGALFGWEGMPVGKWTEAEQEQIVKNRRKIEGKIKDQLIGVKSDLKPETSTLLMKLFWITSSVRMTLTIFTHIGDLRRPKLSVSLQES